jgi:lipopolysaccharide transport system permease protein
VTFESKAFSYDFVSVNTAEHASTSEKLRLGAADMLAAAKMWRLWCMLGWNDIRQRYRRSFIGPFWITLSMAIFTVLLGVVYSFLFKMSIETYLPYVAMGLVSWGFVSTTITDASGVFTGSTSIIEQIRLPHTLHVLRANWRTLIILFHTVVLIIPIWIFTPVHPTLATLLVVPALILVFLNQVWMATAIGILTTRYRDMVQIVTTIIQIAMFVTPIMYPASALGQAWMVAEVNPLYHLVSLVREPLLGEAPQALSFAVVAGMSVVGFALTALLLYRANRRLIYWL